MKIDLSYEEIQHVLETLKRQKFRVEQEDKIELVKGIIAKLEVIKAGPGLFEGDDEQVIFKD